MRIHMVIMAITSRTCGASASKEKHNKARLYMYGVVFFGGEGVKFIVLDLLWSEGN